MKRLVRLIQDVALGFVHVWWSTIFGDMVHRGVRLLVVVPDFVMKKHFPARVPEVIQCRVSVRGDRKGDDCVYAYRAVDGRRDIEVVRFADRGVTWCYGWREEDKKALHVMAALEHSR